MTLEEIAQRASQVTGGKIPAEFIYAQIAHETGGGDSKLAREDHNYGGVTTTKPSPGMEQPEAPNSGYYYKHFDSDEEFADYYGKYLSLYEEDGIFEAKTISEYVAALKHGQYFAGDTQDYINGMSHFAKSIPKGETPTSGDFGSIISNAQRKMDREKVDIPQEQIDDATLWDKLEDTLYDSAVWGYFRTAAMTRDEADPDFKLTQERVDQIQKDLGGDYSAALFVCKNAESEAQVRRLVKMKQEDIARRQRVENSSIDATTIGTILGMALDPINYIPVVGAVGKVGKFARYARLAAMGGASNVVERAVTENRTGYQQDYNMAFLLGAIANGGIPAALDMAGWSLRKSKDSAYKLLGKYVDAQEHADAQLIGKKYGNEILHDESFINRLKGLHDNEFVKTITDPEVASHIDPSKKVFALSLDDARQLAKEIGIDDLPDNAKGIFEESSGMSILIKENLGDIDDIRKTILHEQGAHGLKYVLTPEDYKRVMAQLESRMKNNPSPAMLRAMKRAEGYQDLEEVLGYLAEELKPSNPLMKSFKKAIDKSLRSMGVKKAMSDEEFIDLLTKSAKKQSENNNGYRVLADGSCVYRNFKYSTTNLVNPDKLNSTLGNAWDKVSNWFKSNRYFGNVYSMCEASTSKTLKGVGKRLLIDPLLRANDDIPVEQIKRQTFEQCGVFINNYFNIRDKACLDKVHIRGRYKTILKEDFDKMVFQAYNAIYGNNIAGHLNKNFDPQVLKAVDELHRLRETMINTMKNTHRLPNGRQLLDTDWQNLDDEIWRFLDDSSRASFVSKFTSKATAIEFLTEYAKKAAKRDIIEKQLILKKQAKAKKANKGKATDMSINSVTPEELDAAIEKEAKDWATGVVDQNASKRSEMSAEHVIDGTQSLTYMQHRMPLDTSVSVKSPWGGTFSFDEELRSYDFDNTIPLMLNRFSGEVALSTFFSHRNLEHVNGLGILEKLNDNVIELRKTIEQELTESVYMRQISEAQKKDQLETFDHIMNKLRGYASDDDPKTRGEALARILQDLSYARNGANMFVNQFAEISGTVAYEGFSALADICPFFGRIVDNSRLGIGADELIKDNMLLLFGEDTAKYIWLNKNSNTSKAFTKAANSDNAIDKGLDKVSGYARAAANFTSTLNMLPKLTDTMVQSAKKQTLIDIIKWVNGIEMPAYRNPFSKSKLEAAGIKDAEAFKNALKPYMQLKEDFLYKTAQSTTSVKHNELGKLDLASLQSNDLMTFMRLRTLIENQSFRCITQPTIGSDNMLKESSPFWKVFFQFKDFTMRASYSQSFRALNSHEKDDYLAMVFSTFTNGLAFLALQHMRAWGKYGNDENKRKEFLDGTTSLNQLMYAGFMRSSIATPLSGANDIAETLGVSPLPSIRTTVNRYNDKQKNIFENRDEVVGSIITQLPAVKTGLDIGVTGLQFVQDTLNPEDEVTQREVRKFMELLPYQNSPISMRIREELMQTNALSSLKYKD